MSKTSKLTFKPNSKTHLPFTPNQSYNMSKLGMWIFIVTELLFFGALFVLYTIFRYKLPETWLESSKLLSVPFGALNTVVLLISSFTVAWAVEAVKEGKIALVNKLVAITLLCAFIFMVVKGVEYNHKTHHQQLTKEAIPKATLEYLEKNNKCFRKTCDISPLNLHNLASKQIEKPVFINAFFVQYFIMTGIHGLHVLIGIGLFIWILKLGLQRKLSATWYIPVEVVALYWHLVDVIWIFIFPLLYLAS